MEFLSSLKLIFLIILLIICLGLLVMSIVNMFISAPFIPTSKKTVKKMVEAADLKKDQVVYDFGSGDGRIIIEAAKKGVKVATGFEINPLLVWYSKFKSKLLKQKNTLFINKSFWKADLSKCDVLFLYLLTKPMSELEEKIRSEMKEGSIIISNTFTLPKFKPIKVIDNKIKIYKVEK